MRFSTKINIGAALILVSLLVTSVYVVLNERETASFPLADSTMVTMLICNAEEGTYQVFVNADSIPTLWGESHDHYRYYVVDRAVVRRAAPTVLFLRMMTGAVKVARGDTLYIRRMR